MKYILLIVLALIVGTMAFVFGWFGIDEQTVVITTPVVESEAINATEEAAKAAENERYEAIQAEYKKLEKARRNLDRRLAHIKAIMWGVTLPPEQGEDVVSKIRKGYELLKTKKLLGAFSSLQDISDELAQVEYAHDNLAGVIETIKTSKAGG